MKTFTRDLDFVNFTDANGNKYEDLDFVNFNGVTVYEAWRELTKSGVPPITLQKCKGVDLVDYKIYGESVQEGENLFDGQFELGGLRTTIGVTFEEQLLDRNDRIRTVKPFIIKKNRRYTIVAPITNSLGFRMYDENGLCTYANSVGMGNKEYTFNSGENTSIAFNVVDYTDINVKYEIYEEQSTDNPVEIESVGDKSKNLFNEKLLLEHYSVEKTAEGYSVSSYPAVYTSDTELVKHIKTTLKADTTYTLSRKVSNYASSSSGLIQIRDGRGTGSTSLVSVTLGNGVKSTTFSLTQEQIDSITDIYVYGKADTPTVFEYIQLEEGDTATEYEPYGYKIPVKVSGKNLLDISSIKQVSGRQSNFKLNAGQTYYFSFNFISTPQDIAFGTLEDVYCGVYISKDSESGYKSFSITSEIDTYLTVSIGGTPSAVQFNEVFTIYTSNFQIEYGGVTTYEPYKEIITNLYLDEPLRKIGDYTDYIDFINSKVIRKNKSFKLYAKSWLLYKNLGSIRAYRASNILPDSNKTDTYNTPNMSNMFRYLNGGSIASATETSGEWLALRSGTVYLAIKTDGLSEVTEEVATEYINSLNAEVIYQLATPIEETIELPNIPTHKGTTVIDVDTDILPSDMQVKYYGKE